MFELLHLLGLLLAELVLYLILLPLMAIVATPVILIGAAFARPPYLEAVRKGYRRFGDFWEKCLSFL